VKYSISAEEHKTQPMGLVDAETAGKEMKRLKRAKEQ
jgi:hypothetical protein